MRNLSREASAFCVKLQIYKGYLSKRKENMDIDCCECTPQRKLFLKPYSLKVEFPMLFTI